MRKFNLQYISSLLLILLFAGCVRDNLNNQKDFAGVEFSMSEAKSFFEDTYSYKVFSRSQGSSYGDDCNGGHSHNILSAEPYTPIWDRAAKVTNQYVTAYDVPIFTDKVILAYYPPTDSKPYEELVEATQKVIVAKSNENEEAILSYVATSIPTPEFFFGKNYKAFSHLDTKYQFSGVVVISDLNDDILSVTRYDRGYIAEHVDMRNENLGATERVEIANELLSPFVLIEYQYRRIQSRAAENDGGNVHCSKCGENHPPQYICPVITVACPVCNGRNVCWCCPVCRLYPCGCSLIGPCGICGRPLNACPGHSGSPDPTLCTICQIPLTECPGHGVPPVPPDPPEPSDPPCNTQTTYARTQLTNEVSRIKQAIANNNYQQPYGTFNDFQNAVSQQPGIEHSATLGDYTDSSHGYLLTTPHTDGNSNNVTIRVYQSTIAAIHNHPPGSIPAPSALDLHLIASKAADFPKFQVSIIYNQGGDSYALYINSHTLLDRFFQAYQGQFDKQTGAFVAGSQLENYFNSVQSLKSGTEQYVDKFAALLAHYNTGVVLMKLDMDGPQTNASQYVVKKHDLNDSLVFTECKN